MYPYFAKQLGCRACDQDKLQGGPWTCLKNYTAHQQQHEVRNVSPRCISVPRHHHGVRSSVSFSMGQTEVAMWDGGQWVPAQVWWESKSGDGGKPTSSKTAKSSSSDDWMRVRRKEGKEGSEEKINVSILCWPQLRWRCFMQ